MDNGYHFPLAMSNSHRDSSPSAPTRRELYERLAHVSLTEERSFRRRLSKARAPKALSAISADIDKAAQRIELIDAHVPTLEYPAALPVSERKDDIADAIANNRSSLSLVKPVRVKPRRFRRFVWNSAVGAA